MSRNQSHAAIMLGSQCIGNSANKFIDWMTLLSESPRHSDLSDALDKLSLVDAIIEKRELLCDINICPYTNQDMEIIRWFCLYCLKYYPLAYIFKHKLTMKRQNNKAEFEKRYSSTGMGECISYMQEIK